MRSLFATILAITASASALPAIASIGSSSANATGKASSHPSLITQASPPLSASPTLRSVTFAQRSLNLAKQIPTDAIALLTVDLDRLSWQAFEQFQIPVPEPLAVVDKLLRYLGDSSQFSFTKDVQPWMGKELAIAFLSNPENKDKVIVAALSVVVDQQQFETFIKKLKTSDLPKPTETLYKNITILEWQSRDEDDKSEEPPKLPELGFKRVAIAKLPNDIVVVASDRLAIQKMIDMADPELQLPSLTNNQLFLRSLNNPLWNRSLLAVYGDFKGIAQLSELLAADLPEQTEIPGFSRAEYLQGLKYTLGQYSSFDLFTWVTPKGLRSQSSSYFSELRSPQPKDSQSRDRLLSYLPLNIYGAITSRNLNRQWQWLVEESKLQPSYKIFVEGLRILSPLIISSGLNLDIEKDIISWIDGEYALAIFPSALSPFKEFGVDLTVGALIRTSKPEVANATLAKLTKYFGELDKEFLQIKKRQVGNILLTSFEFPDGREAGKTQSIFAYGWRDRQTLLLTLGANTASAFIPVPKPALAESEDFRDAIADMPQPNFGYFYLNANAIAKQLVQFIFLTDFIPNPDTPADSNTKREVPEPLLKVIKKLGGVVFVYSETSDRFQADFFLGLKP